MKRAAKENFEKNLDNIILENASNPKTYWKLMKMLIKSNKGSNNIPPLQNINNDPDFTDTVYDDLDKCNLLNKYFSLISSVDDRNTDLPDFPSRTNNVIDSINITIQEIIDIIQILDPNKASGPDSISHRMLKICPADIAVPLLIIFNKSLEQCRYPSSWKIANVCVLFKKGDSSLPSNYRPISLISCVGKIMERVVFKHVYNHLQLNKLIYQYQSGFLPKRSTVHQLLEIYNCILNSLENREISCFVFCDFSRAFDKVWHRGLVHKMAAYGIKGDLLNWFKSYLDERKQRVVMKCSSSELCSVSAGVPQGSVLGPLLFVIYINDIADNLISLCRLFADDTSFGYSNVDIMQIKSVIDHDLSKLDTWSKNWLMCFNPSKTELIMFSNVNIPEVTFQLNGEDIVPTDIHKHLGVTFSSDARWNVHIDNIVSSVSKHLNVLRKLKFKLSRKNLEKIFLTYIRPILEYCSELWDSCGVTNSDKLERLHLEAARIITGLPIFTSSDIIYKEIGWDKLEVRRKQRKLQMLHSIFYNRAPDYLTTLLPPRIQSTTIYPLRNGEDLIVPFCRLSLTKDSFFPSTIRSWNELPPATRNIESISKFKKEVKNFSQKVIVPEQFLIGPRKLNIILTQLRCSASFLNSDLHRVNIINSPSCRCGFAFETSYHYFFECSLYLDARNTLLNEIDWVSNYCNIDLDLLIGLQTDISVEQYSIVLNSVYDYIKRTERFVIV